MRLSIFLRLKAASATPLSDMTISRRHACQTYGRMVGRVDAVVGALRQTLGTATRQLTEAVLDGLDGVAPGEDRDGLEAALAPRLPASVTRDQVLELADLLSRHLHPAKKVRRDGVANAADAEWQASAAPASPSAESPRPPEDDPFLAAKLPTRSEKLKENPVYLAQLREESRRAYLKKREQDQLAVQKKVVADLDWLRRDRQLTAAEEEKLEYKKQSVALAERLAAERQDRGAIDAYHMPETYDDDVRAKRLAVLRAKYAEVSGAGGAESAGGAGASFDDSRSAWEAQNRVIAEVLGGQGAPAAGSGGGASAYPLLDEKGVAIEFEFDGRTAGNLGGASEDFEAATGSGESGVFAGGADGVPGGDSESLAALRRQLPIFPFRSQLLRAIRKHPVLIVIGETGSGKTTQVAQYLAEAGYAAVGCVGVTQPRRVAAMSVAARVARERGVKLGREVGYSIRFEEVTSEETKIKFMTDGMLLRELGSDPQLLAYSVVMIDEAHERTLHTDVLFALARDLIRARQDDLKLIISSATLEAEKFSAYFDDAPIFKIPGRKFPVDVYYTLAPEADYLASAATAILQIHRTQPVDSGDILCFLPGQQEIEEVQEDLMKRMRFFVAAAAENADAAAGSAPSGLPAELIVLPIYANLPSDLQAKIFAPTPVNARKCVLATNIAETSITIDNVVYVVDPGFVKQKNFNPKSGLESLDVVPCSRAAAAQRAGRAGRVRPGKCFRLYTKWSYANELEDANTPEILRSNLGSVVLALKAMGIDDIVHFDFMDNPPASALLKALEVLAHLGALDGGGALTPTGRKMADFPLDPMYSRMLIAAAGFSCTEECVTVAAMLSVGASVFYRPKDKQLHADNARKDFARGAGGDLLALLAVYDRWAESDFSPQWCFENFVQYRSLRRARDVRDQLAEQLQRADLPLLACGADGVAVRRAATCGFFLQTARLNKNGNFTTLTLPRQTVDIHPSSFLFPKGEGPGAGAGSGAGAASTPRPKLLLYTELVRTNKEYMRNVIEVAPQWLAEAAPHFCSKTVEEMLSEKHAKYGRRAAAAEARRKALDAARDAAASEDEAEDDPT